MTKKQMLRILKCAGDRLIDGRNRMSCVAIKYAALEEEVNPFNAYEVADLYAKTIAGEKYTSIFWMHELLGVEAGPFSPDEALLPIRLMAIAMFHAMVEVNEVSVRGLCK